MLLVRVAETEEGDVNDALEAVMVLLGAENELLPRVKSDEEIDMLASIAYS